MPAAVWVKTKAVLAHFSVEHRTLRGLMRDADLAELDRIWVNIGQGRRPEWRWDATQLDAWLLAVGDWRAKQPPGRRRRY